MSATRLASQRPAMSGHDRLRVLDVAQMVAAEPPPIPYVIEGIAIERTLTLISGREGEGKSLLGMALTAGVAQGESVAGIECQRTNVLLVDAENGEYEIHRRVKALGLPSAGVTVVEAEDFHLGRNLADLESLIERVQPGLVILDSFRSLWPGGDENDSAAVAAVLDPLRNMLRRQGPAGILLHHVSRAGNDYRGTSAIGASIEVGFRLARHPKDPDRRDRRSLHCFKSRPAPEPEDRWLRLHVEREQVFIEAAESFVGEEGGECSHAPKRTELAPSLIAAAADPTEWPDLARAIGRSPKDGTARRLRDELLKAGELVKLDDGRLRVPGAKTPIEDGTVAPTGTAQ
ncbi:MAG TPA: AAA family ATPase [Solirubrobacterales bacterium]